jgi:hypothetical protein
MAEKPKSHKELVENLNLLVAEAHAQAPEAERRQIEKGYEEVIHQLGHILTVFTPAFAGSATGTCEVTYPGNPPTTMTYNNVTKAYCDKLGGIYFPKQEETKPHPK